MNGWRLRSSLLVVSGLWLAAPAVAAARTVLFPGAARLAGASSTAWRSDVVLHNPTAAAQSVQLELLPRGSAVVSASAQLALAAGETRQVDNVFDFLHAGDGAGMLRVTGDVIAWVRTYNQGAAGTFGQDLVPIGPDDGYGAGEAVVFPFSTAPDIKTAFRSNLILVNREATAITVTLQAGSTVKTSSVPAGAYAQIDNLGAFLGTPAGFGAVRATADGRWFGVISTVDPVTGDPTTVRGLGPGETGERLFPGVASLTGNNQTAWRSEAVFYNPSESSVTATIELIPRGSSAVAASTALTLAPGETRRLADVYQTLGASSGAGALRVTGGALAWVRTFNQGPQGTFGQDLPPVDQWTAVGASVPVALPFRSAASIQTDFRSNLVVQNLESRDIVLSVRAGAIEKTQTVKALAYVQIDNLGGFLALPPGVGTVWVQADGQWAGTISTIDPFTGDPTTVRDDRAFHPPTSAELIDAALAAQTIDAEQALVYKVYADFADPRLPAALRGDDRNVSEANATEVAAASFSSLSAANQDLVGPFLVQPFYQGSWWDLRRASASSTHAVRSACRPWATLCAVLDDWDHVDGTNVRVWYLKSYVATEPAVAADLAAAATSDVWPKLASSIGRVPKPDGTEGGNALLDVILSDGLDASKHGITLPTGLLACRDTPAYVTLNRNITDRAKLKSVMAHEIFHAAQFAVPTQQCLSSIKWLGEGTATWFEDYVYPTTDREHLAAPYYLSKPNLSLDDDGGVAGKNYGAYLFFFYLTRVRGLSPSTIGKIWDATASSTALYALDSALRAAGAELDKSWPEFAVYALNGDPPFDAFSKLDRLAAQAKVIGPRSGSLGTQDATWYIASKDKLNLPRLSIQYYYYEFPDATASNVAFFNGLTRVLNKIAVEDYGDVYTAADLPPNVPPSGGHITGLLKINGKWTKEDWTDAPFRAFCRDQKSDRLEELVVILSNAHIDEPSGVWPQGQYPPLLYASNIGCGNWEGEAHLQWRWGDAVVETMTVTGLRLEPLTDGLYDEDTPLFRAFTVSSGGYSYSVTGSDQGCSYSAGVSAQIAGGLESSFHTLPWVFGGIGHRGLVSELFFDWLAPLFVLNESCPGGSATTLWHAGEFVLASIPEWTWARFSSDGKSLTIDTSKVPDRTGFSGSWTLHAKREP